VPKRGAHALETRGGEVERVMIDRRVPVSVLTGYLGAGKTTLLNRILSEQHGRRVAVIVNEFGEVGIDEKLVVRTDEHVVEMNNGCICCTVRDDLITAVGELISGPRSFERIIIETTGLADPAPVIQSFFVAEALARGTRLDAIITLVDAFHVGLHWDAEEVKEQIAFADVILLNKIDLVPEAELEALTERLRALTPLARIHRSLRGAVPLELLLDVGAFDLARALSIDPELLRDTTHEHDASVGSVCLERPGALSERALSRWLAGLVQAKGADLFRMKGILNVDDARRRFVLQGVHMLLDGRPGAPWQPGEERVNQLVFIGRNLDRRELERGFEGCFNAEVKTPPPERERAREATP
jgi:G3E family GTPase